MKFVFASDSFKGTLSSEQTGELLQRAAREVFGDCETVRKRMADGGEGTMDAILYELGGKKISVNVHDPLMKVIRGYYGMTQNRIAVIEMAQASGLPLVPKEKRNPLYTSSYGTGELVRDALENGADEILLAIGGSATNDGGMGFANALGVKFLDKAGRELEGKGIDLEKVANIDVSGMFPKARRTKFTVMCDVTNPLCGTNGATYTYGRQKGASDEELLRLEMGMQNYRDVIRKEFGIDPDQITGSGAAGGMGAALSVFFHAKMKSGVETVLDIIKFDDIIRAADYIITGEGRADGQSVNGKVLSGVGKRGLENDIPVIALCGSLGEGYEKLSECGIVSMLSVSEGVELEDCMKNAEHFYYKKAVEMFGRIKESRLNLDSQV